MIMFTRICSLYLGALYVMYCWINAICFVVRPTDERRDHAMQKLLHIGYVLLGEQVIQQGTRKTDQ